MALGGLPVAGAKRKHLGVQLYSVRGDMDKNPLETLKKVAAIGYREVEGAGYNDGKFYGYAPQAFAKLLKSLGLSMPSGHFTLATEHLQGNALTDVWKKGIDAAAAVGQRYLISPWVKEEDRAPERMKRLVEGFSIAAEAVKAAGMQFAYHNHDFEFKPFGDQLLYDYILKQTDPALVKMQLDLYWVVYAGQDPVEWFKRHPGRFPLYHVKDMAKTARRETIEVGAGSIDFAQIFRHDQVAGVKHYVVELEHYRTTPLQGIEEAYRGFKQVQG